MSIWTIECASNGVNGTFAALGLSNLNRTLLSQAADRVSFVADGASVSGDPLFPYNAVCIIRKDGVQWFRGVVTSIPRQGMDSSQQISYELQGPWRHLEKIVYYQTWRLYNSGSGALADDYMTRCILCQHYSDGSPMTTGEQIEDALQSALYLMGVSPQFQIGTIDPGLTVPFDEGLDLTCADVIIRMLRYTPDMVCWFDYTTDPPTLHCRAADSLAALNLSLESNQTIQGVNLTPRYDLQLPGVELIFERTVNATIGGQNLMYSTVTRQRAGNYLSQDAMLSTQQLSGSMLYEIAHILTETWPASLTANDAATKAFIKAHVQALEDVPDADWSVLSASRKVVNIDPDDGTETVTETDDTLARLLREGCEIPEWLTSVSGIPVHVTLQISRTVKGKDGEVVEKKQDQVITFRVTSTDAETKDYGKLIEADMEVVPAGMADALYSSWSRLQYDGQVTLLERDCGSYSPGMVINIAGGRSEWQTMAALIQQVHQLVDLGQTVITVGPQRRISLGDLMDTLRSLRSRKFTMRNKERRTGAVRDRGNILVKGAGNPARKEQAAVDQGERSKLSLSKYGSEDELESRIDLDSETLSDVDTYKVLQKIEKDGVALSTWDWVRAHA